MNLTTNKACNILSFLNKYKYRNLYYVRWEKNSKGGIDRFPSSFNKKHKINARHLRICIGCD